MALLNHATRELTAKIVYYGPGLCGKTTNLNFVYEVLEEEQRGPMLSLATEADRTLFFDFLPLDLGSVKGFRVRVQLYTVPGQVFYEETRRRVLKGADGVVFIADSQRDMADANRESFRQLHEHLRDNGFDPHTVPLVLQYNKRDLKDILSLEELDRDLNPDNAPIFEAVASQGVGVEDTLRAISRLVLKNLITAGGEVREAVGIRMAPEPLRAVPPPAPVLQEESPFWSETEQPFPEEALETPSAFVLEEQTDESAALLASSAAAFDNILDVPEVFPAPSVPAPPLAAVLDAPAARPTTSASPSVPAPEAASAPLEIRVEPGRPLDITVLIGGQRFKLRVQIEPEG